MSCKSCQSTNQRVFESEVNIHFSEVQDLKRQPVLAFPSLVICLDCGFMESRMDEDQLRKLIEGGRGTKDVAD